MDAVQHHHQLLPPWTGLIVVVTIIGLEYVFRDIPPIKGQKRKVVLSSMDHHVDCVTTQILWGHPQLQLRQREPFHDCYVSDFLFLLFNCIVCCCDVSFTALLFSAMFLFSGLFCLLNLRSASTRQKKLEPIIGASVSITLKYFVVDYL